MANRWALFESRLDAHTVKIQVRDGVGVSVTWEIALTALCSRDGELIEQIRQSLITTPFASFYVDFTPVSLSTQHCVPFEFVVTNAPELARGRTADPFSFRAFLDGQVEGSFVSFKNLGKDALLLAPVPSSKLAEQDYLDLASFLRSSAPAIEKNTLFSDLGLLVMSRLRDNANPVWVGCDGRSVPWLHMRVDERPKYVKHLPFKSCMSKGSDTKRRVEVADVQTANVRERDEDEDEACVEQGPTSRQRFSSGFTMSSFYKRR